MPTGNALSNILTSAIYCSWYLLYCNNPWFCSEATGTLQARLLGSSLCLCHLLTSIIIFCFSHGMVFYLTQLLYSVFGLVAFFSHRLFSLMILGKLEVTFLLEFSSERRIANCRGPLPHPLLSAFASFIILDSWTSSSLPQPTAHDLGLCTPTRLAAYNLRLSHQQPASNLALVPISLG